MSDCFKGKDNQTAELLCVDLGFQVDVDQYLLTMFHINHFSPIHITERLIAHYFLPFVIPSLWFPGFLFIR